MQQPERSQLPSSSSSTSPPYSTDNKLPPLHTTDNGRMLPSLSSITGGNHLRQPSDMSSLDRTPLPPHLHGAMPYRQPPSAVHADSPAPMDIDPSASAASTPSPDNQHEGTPTSVTLDDPDVRLAAEALGDLRADFVSSPPDTTGTMSPPPPPFSRSSSAKPKSPRPEPLLSLLTTSHPLITSTLGGASSAYGGVKNFSPRFKSGAEYVEGYLTPLAKTVNVVGRKTGVEGGVRWFLGGGRRAPPSSDPDAGASKKRRKVGEEKNGQGSGDGQDDSPPTPKSARRLSSASTVDTLPAYDELRSPAYTESAGSDGQAVQTQAWQTRLFMTTSGLSVAMSSESLRSLKYCLKWLKWTNERMGNTIGNLKTALEDYEKAVNPETVDALLKEQDEAAANGGEGGSGTKTPEEKRVEIANRIQTMKGDILKTLQEVVTTVSKYAGGSLPENARVLVRRHLTSLPQRFRLATMSDANAERSGDAKDRDSALRDGAQKVLVLAKEGLDMVTQISGVLDGTIISAEEWCERMGKKREPEKDEPLDLNAAEPPAAPEPTDTKMT